MITKISHILSFLENFVWQILGFVCAVIYLAYRIFIPQKQGSHPISRFFRLVFEQQKARTAFSLLFLVFILFINFFAPINSQASESVPPIVLASSENVIETEPAYQHPVNKGKISQEYHWYHQGIDICADLGAKIKPIAAGTIQTVKYTSLGYGHYLVISHDNNHQSLYAHMGMIKVKEGEKVDKDTVLGYVGLTGWTTGPHVHLEIYEDGKTLNPQEVLPDFSN